MDMNQNQVPRHEHIYIPEKADVSFLASQDSGSYVPPHWHQEIEIIYLLSGSLDVSADSRNYPLAAGDIILVNSKTLHATKCIHGNQAILMLLPFSFLSRYIPDIGSCVFTLNSLNTSPHLQDYLDQVRKILGQMSMLNARSENGWRLPFSALLFNLIDILYQQFSIRIASVRSDRQIEASGKLDSIFRYTQKHYDRPVSVREISNTVGFSPEYFCRFFKKHVGTTYLEYLNNIRLSQIYYDLIMTDVPVGRLLDKHGFSNYKLFRRLFRKHFFCTPGEIRKRHRVQGSQSGNPDILNQGI